MKINVNYLTKFLSSILLFICSRTLANQRDLVSIDGTYSRIYTSPLIRRSNISNLMKVDFSRPLDCITTLELESSWVLIDLGFVKTGIAQLRLYGENFNEISHKYLSNIEIKGAHSFPMKEISNSFQHENTYFETCGTTGTVSQNTHNAVVDCIKEIDARWILLKKKNILGLCYVNILQSTVKPNCFHQILPNNKLFPTVSSNLTVFRFVKNKTPLECFQDCFNEFSCQGTAFIPYKTNGGYCQLLKTKYQRSNLNCDSACILSVNLCHLGQKLYIGSSNKDILLKVPSIKKDSYAISVEVNGNISCNEANCGKTEIFIIDSNGEVNLCSRINPLNYKFLVKEVFICENLVKNPSEIILKTQTKNQLYTYIFDSIVLRITEENSFVYEIFSYSNNKKSLSTKVMETTLLTTETPKISTSDSTILKTKSSVSLTTVLKTKSFILSYSKKSETIKQFSKNTSKNDLKNSSFKFTTSVSNKPIISKQISIDENVINSIKTISSKLSTPFTKTKLETVSRKINLKLSVIDSKDTSNQEQIKNPNIKFKNNKEILFTTAFTKSLINLKDDKYSSTQFLRNLSESLQFPNQSTLPYNWIILVIFLGILISVTLIVLLITFFESRRKKKEWDIPPHGLFPLDQVSEQITLQSSLQESTIRKVS